MKAVVYRGPGKLAVENQKDPEIQEQSDAIIRLTTSGICGSDLHMYEGRTAAEPGIVLGHENMGVVEKVGSDVKAIRVGDRVVLPFNIACGFCFNCSRGYTSACLTANPDGVSAGYGYVGMGPHRGGQAELLRVPYADFNCLKLPGTPGDEFEDDFLLLSDVFPTGYHGTELAHVEPGSTVAIFGAGPVGLLAAHSAFIRGASEVYVVDRYKDRLDLAKKLGAVPIDFTQGDPVEQIKNLRLNRKDFRGSLRPGEEKMAGVMCGIDAVGYQSFDSPSQILEWLSKVVNPTGSIGIVGVYLPQDPGGSDEKKKKGIIDVALGDLFDHGVTIGMGQTPVKKYNVYLRDLILSGRAKPSQIVSHRISLDEVPEAYRKFDQRGNGYTKVVIKQAA